MRRGKAARVLRGVATCALLVAVAGCGGSDEAAATLAPAPDSAAAVADCGLPGFRDELVARTNALRAAPQSCGGTTYPAVPPLAWHDALARAAAGHSEDMARNNYFAHDSLDGRSPFVRIRAAGYDWRAAGENLAVGPRTVAAVMQGWRDSADHCANLMHPTFREVGVACVRDAGGRPYWTMNLGARR